MQVGDLLVKLGADFTQYNKDLAKAEGMAKKSGSTIGDIFKNAFSVTLGMGVFDAAKKGFNAITNAGIGFNAMMQTANIGFATMLGSAQKADRFLSDLAEFAKVTPFEFPELVDAAKRMLAYGFAAEEVIPILTAVGDAAAGLGAGKEGIVSIHTPARGVTLFVCFRYIAYFVSIHTPARGVTGRLRSMHGHGLFQSTPPRGG